MRLSEIGSKEIVDLSKGSSHGQLWDTEMLFERKTGVIKAVLIPSYQSKGPFRPLLNNGSSCLGTVLSRSVKT